MSDQPTPMKKSFIEFNQVNLKETNQQLKRIADCLVIIVQQMYNINPEVPTRRDDGKDESEVTYATDEASVITEVLDFTKGRKRDGTDDEIVG
jgi:hypothetical protein